MARRKPPVYSEEIDGFRCEVRTTRDEYEVDVIKDGETVGEWAYPRVARTVTVETCHAWATQAVIDTKRDRGE